MQSLDDLLAPLTATEFCRQYWNRRYLLQAGDPDRFTDLLSWSELNHLVEFAALHPPRLRLVLETRNLSESHYMESYAAYPHVNVAGMTEALAKGATLVIDRIDHLVPQLHRLARGLQVKLRCGVGMNMYGSWRTQKGFDLHWDRHDVLVLQVSGRKRWKVYEPTRLHPLQDDSAAAPEPTAPPVWEGVLETGSVLYLPRGWWHVAQAMDEASLHITISLRPYTGVDLLTFLVDGLRDHPEVRQYLPHLGTEEERAAYTGRLRELLAEAAAGDLLPAFEADRAQNKLHSDLSPSLPGAVSAQLKPLGAGARVRLTQRTPLPLQPSEQDGIWRLKVDGKEWPCEEDVRRVLQRLSHVRAVSLEELTAAAGGPATQLKLRMMLTVLQSNGLLYVG